jgi:pyridoxine 4-dehydrogenase
MATTTAAYPATFTIGGDLTVNRLGYGAMRITGEGIWGPPQDHDEAIRVLKRAVELGVNFIDTADSYGPNVSEELIAEALHPYQPGLLIATKGGLLRTGPNQWPLDGSPKHLESTPTCRWRTPLNSCKKPSRMASSSISASRKLM